MSVQFGRCNFDGKPVDPHDLDKARSMLAAYGPDGEGCICRDSFGILYGKLHTTKESCHEQQPHILESGSVLTYDGRLDNRSELVAKLGRGLSWESTDLDIVSAAYERWEVGAFRELVGDWALSIWNPHKRSAILAKDFVGTRHLYYTVVNDQLTWSTVLEALILLSDHKLALEEEYLAGWLAFLPATHLTPFSGVRSVPASSFVQLGKGQESTTRYWDFDPAKAIRLGTDVEYEEQFRQFFMTAVRRRLRSNRPVLAELSGGMDSSSIVCMADSIFAKGSAQSSRLDTVSYYNDSEPNWNERPYFLKIEEKRRRPGCHIEVGSQLSCLGFDKKHFSATPGTNPRPESARQLARYTSLNGHVALLSGTGGDEVLGGIPSPIPELSDLLTTLQLRRLARQITAWALAKRKPVIGLLADIILEFLPVSLVGAKSYQLHSDWLEEALVKRQCSAVRGYERRLRLHGPRPSFQENLRTLDSLRRQLGCTPVLATPPLEVRYPYLDRDLLEFLYSIPREQLVRPRQRRSLMRRALKDIVPVEVLNRRKASVVLKPLAELAEISRVLLTTDTELLCARMGIVNRRKLRDSFEQLGRGQNTNLVGLLRTVTLEFWLRDLLDRSVVQFTPPIPDQA